MSTGINVRSEIGQLKKVMVHRPGEELVYFADQDFDRVWFHDALFLERAQEEHDEFTRLLREAGAEVLYLEDLLAEAIAAAPAEARDKLLADYIDESGLKSERLRKACGEFLASITDPKELSLRLLRGIRSCELEIPANATQTLEELDGGELPYTLIDPMPAIYFSRDTFATIGNGVSIHHMYQRNRNREPLLGEFIFANHPDYRDTPVYYRHSLPYHIEGGDIMNIDAHTLGIGLSQRTEAAAIDTLAQNLFWGDESSEITRIYAFKIPQSYAFMHLDTVFTQVDVDKFTVYPGIISTLKVYLLQKGAQPGQVRITEKDETLEQVLEEITGLDSVKLLECGGGEPALAAREQWNDGSNTLAVAPGVVCVYERNVVTNDLLYKEGLKLLVVPSAELSRGRGGPRCMSMPFERAAL
jgi:arginine deiminase